jgi:hypothetical protein
MHRHLVKESITRFLTGISRPIIVDFHSFENTGPEAVTALKESCAYLLARIDEGKEGISISSNVVQSPPSLAGLLLSYPLIYNSEDPTFKLFNAEVVVFSVCTDSTLPRTLMQFSSPPSVVDQVQTLLEEIVKEWEDRMKQLSLELKDRWSRYTGVESCTLKIQVETRRAPLLSL